ncbi:hypothetical protein QWJ34_15065 [Saccharibacillus sp. CPCC 101409]|uniref:hypothetical protein n=1 Tax=Saccharibacillus sp. CPCC 101409 TaxID=3058041 RepID=UPI00267313A6|nr:hypothetical protein [Saccharibacillus sp. CPCC 101409]MDO3411084.1 hypothetical protein [Saccharibacillus sp. CPCC 101409]
MTVGEDGRIAGVFDVNIAGDEVLVGELCALLVYYALMYPPAGMDADAIMEGLLSAYTAVRPLSEDERGAIAPLLQILPPFRFERVRELRRLIAAGVEDPNGAESQAERKARTNGREEVDVFARDTILRLERIYPGASGINPAF